MARKPAAKAALMDPQAQAALMPELTLQDGGAGNTCKNCQRYSTHTFGDHGRCAVKPATSMMKAWHVCAIDKFVARA